MSAYPHAKFLTSADAARQFPPDRGREVAIAGRSNAGKSSALNALLGRRGLARTSRTPGATRLINFFEISPDRRLVDRLVTNPWATRTTPPVADLLTIERLDAAVQELAAEVQRLKHQPD